VTAVLLGALAVAVVVAFALWQRQQELAERLQRATARAETAEAERPAAAGAERLMRALDAIPEGVVVCDERGDVVYENDGGAAFARARHGEALVAAGVAEALGIAIAGQQEERTLELFGPPRRTLVVTAYPLTGDGRAIGAMAVIQDVSEHRRLESVRRDFVANISHELKTPIGALALLAETLLSEDDPATRQRLTERLLEESHRVGRTIDDLLSLSRIEAQEQHTHPAVPVLDVIEEAVARTAPAAEQRGIRIDEAPVPPGLGVEGDSRQLVSALYNLLENAVKYSDPGSAVEVSAREAEGWAEMVVADRGPGIPTRDLERIFERFYRVDRGRSRDTGGTGLGLAIVRHVATNHGGEVTVQSREGEGSTFVLRLPSVAVPVVEGSLS
jgi:two-component system sensor histidine kinase SenX3